MDEQKHILIVDDEEVILELIEAALSEDGYKFTKVTSADEALKLYKADPCFDLIVSDIRMDGTHDGVQLLDLIKQATPFNPIIIMMTGFADVQDWDIYDLGASAFLKKPFDIQELRDTVKESLKSFPKYSTESNDSASVIKVELNLPSLTEAISSKCINLGQGGMYVKTEYFAPPKSIITFKLEFESETPTAIDGSGEVVWKRERPSNGLPVGMGIKFISLSHEQEKFIAAFVIKHKIAKFIPKQ